MKVVCTFGPFLFGGQTERQTDRPKQWKCQRFNEGHSWCKKEAFVEKKEHSGGHLKSHIISCSAKCFTRFQTAPLFLTLLGNFDRGQRQGGCETVSEGRANTRMREM